MAAADWAGAVMRAGLISGVLLAIAVGACARVEPAREPPPATSPVDEAAIERGAEERPPAGAHLTPTAGPAPATITPTPEFPLEGELSAEGPWVLYCTEDGRAAVMDLDGRTRRVSAFECLTPGAVSPAAGLGLVANNLVQFPAVEGIRWACCEPFGWSQDGSMALLTNPAMIADQSQLIAYDVAADRFRTLLTSSYQTTPLGLSPDGRWVVYREFDHLPETPPSRQPPGQLLAISTDGRQSRAFYSIYGTDPLDESVLGWPSDSTFLIQHQDAPCGDVPHILELTQAELNNGRARHIFDSHSYAALDPRSGTVLLEQVPAGRCPEAGERGPLVLLAPGDGWDPHPLLLGEDWGGRWEVRGIEWHPELDLFSVLVGQAGGGPLRNVMTVTADGQMVHTFPLHDAEHMTGLFPSPGGTWMVLGGSAPHGTRLYDAGGDLVRQLAVEGGDLTQGVQQVLWSPHEEAFLMSMPEGAGIYRAVAETAWIPELIEPDARDGTDLTLVEAPARPFMQACGGRNHTRLKVGDRVMVSHEPPLSSRLRSNPGLAAGVVDLMEPGRQAEVIGGPVCWDGFVWWFLQPERGERSGWAAEGDGQGAWLVPIGASARAAPRPTPAGQPTPAPAGLRLFSPSLLTYETLHTGPGLLGGSLRLIYP